MHAEIIKDILLVIIKVFRHVIGKKFQISFSSLGISYKSLSILYRKQICIKLIFL